MEKRKVDERPIVIALKGHPGTGKSTLGHAIARTLKCPLIDKDHLWDSARTLQEALTLASPATASKLVNDLSYEVTWNMALTQLGLGLSVIIDSPLSHHTHLDRLRQLAARTDARVVIVECKPKDEAEWRRRLEARGAADDGRSWHKARSWQELERLLDGYAGCWDYDVGEVPKLVVDTTANVGVQEIASYVLEFIQSSGVKLR